MYPLRCLTPHRDWSFSFTARSPVLKFFCSSVVCPFFKLYDNKSDDENEVLELLEDVNRDLNNYDLEFRIEELESKFSKDMNEATFNELKDLKKKQNIN